MGSEMCIRDRGLSWLCWSSNIYPLNKKEGRITINCHCIFSSIPVPVKKGKENEDPVSCSHLVLLSCIFPVVRMKTPCHINFYLISVFLSHSIYVISTEVFFKLLSAVILQISNYIDA